MEERKRVQCEMTTYSNDLKRVIREKPCVICEFRCGTCPWNPEEQRRRIIWKLYCRMERSELGPR